MPCLLYNFLLYFSISPDVSIFPSTAEGYEQFVDMCFEVLENTDGDGALAFKILTELVKEMKTTS